MRKMLQTKVLFPVGIFECLFDLVLQNECAKNEELSVQSQSCKRSQDTRWMPDVRFIERDPRSSRPLSRRQKSLPFLWSSFVAPRNNKDLLSQRKGLSRTASTTSRSFARVVHFRVIWCPNFPKIYKDTKQCFVTVFCESGRKQSELRLPAYSYNPS